MPQCARQTYLLPIPVIISEQEIEQRARRLLAGGRFQEWSNLVAQLPPDLYAIIGDLLFESFAAPESGWLDWYEHAEEIV